MIETYNAMMLFAKSLGEQHIKRQELIIPRDHLKMIRAMYNTFGASKSGIKYKYFLVQVERTSIQLNIHYLKVAEILSKSIGGYGK
jgi:hypothetical protein